MNEEIKKEIEILTDKIMEARKRGNDENYEIVDTENSRKFKSSTNQIIPMIKEASIIIGRSGCSLNYYSNELAIIKNPKEKNIHSDFILSVWTGKITLV